MIKVVGAFVAHSSILFGMLLCCLVYVFIFDLVMPTLEDTPACYNLSHFSIAYTKSSNTQKSMHRNRQKEINHTRISYALIYLGN